MGDWGPAGSHPEGSQPWAPPSNPPGPAPLLPRPAAPGALTPVQTSTCRRWLTPPGLRQSHTLPPAPHHPAPWAGPQRPLASLAGLVPLILGGTGQLPLPAHMAMGGRPKKPALRAGLKEGSPGLRPFGAGGGASRGREVVGRGLESRSPSVGSHESDLRVTAPHLFNPHH